MTTPAHQPRLPHGAECLGCQYPLVGVAEPVYPECGREFNPHDRTTYGPKPTGPTMAWASHGPGLVTLAACGVAVVAWLLAFSTPLRRPPWLLLAVLFSFLLASSFATRLLLSPFAAGSVSAWLAAIRRDWWRWLAVPLAGLLCLMVVYAHVGWWMRWTISRPSMDRLAADVRAGRQVAANSWHGAICVGDARVVGSEVHAQLDIDGNGLSDFTVLIHSPAGPPTVPFRVALQPIDGGWYVAAVD